MKNRFLLLIFTLILIQNNSLEISSELYFGKAQEFANAFDQRLLDIEKQKEKELIILTALPDSLVLKFDDITFNPEDWRNKSFSKYYHLNKIQISNY